MYLNKVSSVKFKYFKMGGISKMKKSVKTGRLLFNIGIVLLMLVTFVSGVSAAGTTGSSELEKLVVAGGPAGGNWYGLAGSIAELIKDEFPDLFVSVMPGGSLVNIELVEKGEVQLGLTVAHLYLSASKGVSPFEKIYKNLRALAEVGISDQALFLVREEIPINSLEELKEKKYPLRLTTSPKTSSPALATARLLEQYQITFDDLKSWGGSVIFTSYSDSVNLVADGHADAFVSAVGPAMVELISRRPMKLLSPKEKIVDQLVEQYGYAKNFMPKGKYPWVVEDAWTIGEPNIILVSIEVPEEIVYRITKILCENPRVVQDWGAQHANFDPKTAWKNVGASLHPGAERYYREAGYMK